MHLCRGPVSNEISAVLPISPVIIVLVSARLSFRLCSSSRRWLSHLGSHHHLRGGLCSLSRFCGWWRIRTKQIPQRTLPPSTAHTTPHDRLKTVCLRSKKLKNVTSATQIQIRNAKYETSAPIPAVIDSRDASRAREDRRRDEGVTIHLIKFHSFNCIVCDGEIQELNSRNLRAVGCFALHSWSGFRVSTICPSTNRKTRSAIL